MRLRTKLRVYFEDIKRHTSISLYSVWRYHAPTSLCKGFSCASLRSG